MVSLKTERQVRHMEDAGRIVAAVLDEMGRMAVPGATTGELNARADEIIRDNGGIPLFLGYHGFPASTCISIDEEVVHGIPGGRELQPGEIVSIDVGVRKKGWCGDAARTFIVGETTDQKRRLVDVTRRSLHAAIARMRPGMALAEVCGAVQSCAEKGGFSVVRQYTGHGIGRQMHEDPQVPNFVEEALLRARLKLEIGMVLAIEPMLNAGTSDVETLKDGWTVVTRDRKPSAHWEHTVAVTEDGPRILTACWQECARD